MNEVHVSRRRPRWQRILVRALVGLLVLAVVLAGVGVWTVRRSFAQYDGVARLAGLSGPVTVYRDAHGIPQVYAHTADDLYRAQGYVHAQERFDKLPADHRPDGNDRWFEVVRALISDPTSSWWASQTPEQVVAAAMRDATDELSKKLGADPTAWRWGAVHRLTVRNQSFGTSGIAPIEWLFNVGPVATSGGSSIVNANGWDASQGYEVIWVPSMRMVVDLSDLDGSRWVQLMGESGHAFSRHYHDQLELWRTGGTLPMRWERSTIQRESPHTLTLHP